MYSLRNLATVLRQPSRIKGVFHQVGMEANQLYYRHATTHQGVDVMAEDWDNLLLLDGCRYDVFAEVCHLDGQLESRISPASESSEFIQENFRGCSLHDTVYITANPYANDLSEGTFHATINLLVDGWDTELQTVRPETMATAVREAVEKYPDKRLIAHFMQPHYPFIGNRGREITQGGISQRNTNGEVIAESEDSDIWLKLQFQLLPLTREEVWDAYRENLSLALNEIECLLEDLSGKTVLTADHGNLVGDWIGPMPCRGYGHPKHLYVDELVRVPWFTIESDERREITEDAPVRHDTITQNTVKERLSDLGYA